jgi:exosortase/archaeosortase family protein
MRHRAHFLLFLYSLKSFLTIRNPIIAFFVKLIALAVVWQSCYNLFLKPIRVPDNWLTNIVTAGSGLWIKLFMAPSHNITWTINNPGSFIQDNGRMILSIYDVCNGLDIIVIYLAFIILLPSTFRRKLIFSVAGIAVIVLSNIIRCVSLYWIYVHYHSSFDFNHHYVFTILMYLVIFGGWLLFIKKQKGYETR